MENKILIIEPKSALYYEKALTKSQELGITILYNNSSTHHIVLQVPSTDHYNFENSFIINNPHPSLLPAFFNLIQPHVSGSSFVIKSKSLISLFSLYQRLLTDENMEPCEIIFNSLDHCYFGLLIGDRITIDIPEEIEAKWVDNANHFNIYAF